MINKKLQILKAVVETGSFTGAAKTLYTSQPAISRDIKQLEYEYEVTIFESTTNKLTLSAAGEVLYNYAVEMDSMNEHIISDLHDITKKVSGDIKIGASHSFGEFVLPDILVDINNKYPALNCNVHIGNSQDVIDHLKDKTIDIGVIEIDKTYAGIELTSLFQDEMVLMMHRNLFRDIDDLKNRRCFVREPYSGTRYYQDRALEIMEIQPARVEINNAELIKECVRNELGFTILSELALGQEDPAEIKVQRTGIKRNFSVVTSKTKYMSSKINAVLECIKSTSHQQ